MPSMDLAYRSAIDSHCAGCGDEDTVDWVQVEDGTRRYLCPRCCQDLLRFDGAEELAELPDTPNARRCGGCDKFTLARDCQPFRPTCQACVSTEMDTLRTIE